jgi:hypothetical protein
MKRATSFIEEGSTMKRMMSILAALALVFTGVVDAKAGIVYSEDWSSLSGTGILNSYSQLGNGYYTTTTTNLPSGWSESGNSSQIIGWFTTSGPYAGVNGVLLNETPPPAGISTTINGLTAGQVYTLTFNYWGDNEAGHPYALTYTINGQATTVNGTDTISGGAGPYQVNYQFTASGSSTTLSFAQDTPSGSPASPIIGDILVTTATPEPASLTMLGIGIAGMAGYTWRRRKLAAA